VLHHEIKYRASQQEVSTQKKKEIVSRCKRSRGLEMRHTVLLGDLVSSQYTQHKDCMVCHSLL